MITLRHTPQGWQYVVYPDTDSVQPTTVGKPHATREAALADARAYVATNYVAVRWSGI